MVSVNTKLDLSHEGIAPADDAMPGGAFPIILKGTGLVGTIIASGSPLFHAYRCLRRVV
jgi:uncharacterized protein (UPF0303 family)